MRKTLRDYVGLIISDAYETRYNYIVKEHENGERQVSYNLTGENSLTLV